MYTPASYRIEDQERILSFIERYSFGALVSVFAGETLVTHLPFLVDRRPGGEIALLAHIARANPHRRALGADAVVVFNGPHSYVTPSWYTVLPEVPTWNYAAVHVRGPTRPLEREAALHFLGRLVAQHEVRFERRWSIADLPATMLAAYLDAIIAFEIPVRRVDATFKFNQNRARVDQQGVVAGLRALGDASSVETAKFMADLLGLERPGG